MPEKKTKEDDENLSALTRNQGFILMAFLIGFFLGYVVLKYLGCGYAYD